MPRRWLHQQRLTLGVGLGLTLAALVVHFSGATAPLERQMYDMMVRRFSRIPASDRILHIDIDDSALDRVSSWPWPRDIQADLIRILHELGADRIVMDIVWPEPRPAEIRTPELSAYADVEGEIKLVGELSAENVVYPDDELAAAIAEAGNVYLSMFYQDPQEHTALSPRETALAEKAADRLGGNFSLRADQLATDLGVPRESIERVLPRAKRHVARDLVTKALQDNPLATARQVHERILQTPFDEVNADQADLLAAYYRQISLRSIRTHCPQLPPALEGRLPLAADLAPSIYKLTAGARQCGYVNFPEDDDGILRHMSLLAEWDGRLVEQLAFAVACDVLDIHPADLSIDDSGNLVIARGSNPPMRIHLNARGELLVNWHAQPKRWQDCFAHLPVTALLTIRDARQRQRQNETLRQVRFGQAMHLAKDDLAYAGYRDQVAEMLRCRRAAHWGKLQGRAEAADVQEAARRSAELQTAINQDHVQTAEFIRQIWADLQRQAMPTDPDDLHEYERFKQAYDILTRQIPALEAINVRIAAQEKERIERLRPSVAGKICLVGYTATAVADMVTAPSHGRMPGVMVHAHVLNSFLQNQFRRWAGSGTQAAVIVLFGLATTLVTSWRGPRITLLIVVATSLLFVAFTTFGLFGDLDYWLQTVTALILAFIAWALIVLVHYLIIDRQRRQFSRAVAQYVSPAMARQISNAARELDFSPKAAEVTCFFSDLAGFTTLSERLGPEGTRAVLNPYLEAMSEALHRHQALINKFMGDGIFAFFNPPILTCPDHTVAACEAALDCQASLVELIQRHADTPLAADFRRLHMRIGIATGSAFVGDFGSATKLDYTCVGDIVNLAARLESANKQFGTTMMVAGPTHDAAGDGYAYRFLGCIQVKGQTVGVQVYELLGRRQAVDRDLLTYAEMFTKAVTVFARREWPEAESLFRQCQTWRPDDPATLRYLPLILQYRRTPPPPDWVAGLELTEK